MSVNELLLLRKIKSRNSLDVASYAAKHLNANMTASRTFYLRQFFDGVELGRSPINTSLIIAGAAKQGVFCEAKV